MRLRTAVLAALIGALLPVVLASNLPAARVTLALVACLLLPGLGWAQKMHLGDIGDTLALAVVLSICMTIAVATAMAVADAWSLGWGLAALGGLAAAGFVPVRLLLDRAGAAVRLRIAGFDNDRGAWSDWYRETLEAQARQARAAADATEASAVWVDWYADAKRRAAEAREREAAAKQAAVDEWISWYQQTHLLKRDDQGS